jgi:hypothetical protein
MNKIKNPQQEAIQKLLLRLEFWFAPILIIVPLAVSLFFLWDWYARGSSVGLTRYDGELLLALLILFGNLAVDVPFLRSIRTLRKKDNKVLR